MASEERDERYHHRPNSSYPTPFERRRPRKERVIEVRLSCGHTLDFLEPAPTSGDAFCRRCIAYVRIMQA